MYRVILSFAYPLVFIANVPNFLYAMGLVPIHPAIYLLTAAFFSLPLIGLNRTCIPNSRLVLWGYGFLVLGASSAVIDAAAATLTLSPLLARISFLLSICIGLVLFRDCCSITAGSIGSAAATVAIVAFNFWELIVPGVFGQVSRRPAGLFENPNISGTSLVFAMLLGNRAIPVQWRPLFQLLAGAGVLITFSRGAIVAWTVSVVLINLLGPSHGVIGRKAGAWLTAGVFLVALISSPAWEKVDSWVSENVDERNIQRLMSLQSGSLVEEDPRSQLAEAYVDLLRERPFTGFGLGAADGRLVDSGKGPHNMFLALMIEHGLVGIVVIPSLALAISYRSGAETADVIVPLCILLVIASFVSHTVLMQWGYGVCIALAASIATADLPSGRSESKPGIALGTVRAVLPD